MSASPARAAEVDDDRPVLEVSAARRLMVLIAVVASSTAYIAATFSATAILPQMQGAMSATQDEISWTMTFNILATAIATPMTGWFVNAFGRRQVLLWSIAGFTVATTLCGLANSLEGLVAWRVVQGAAGAPLIPLGQTILLDVFPRARHQLVMTIYGMANTMGPVLGPALSGHLAENHGWRWGFFMVLPVAVFSGLITVLALPRDRPNRVIAMDWLGFLSMAIAIGAAQLMLSRGQRLDWFESIEIIIELIVATLALYFFVVHSLTTRQPFLNLRLLADRNYAVGLFLVGLFGMLNFTPMVLLPPLLKSELHQPDHIVGLVVSWRGIGVLCGFFASLLLVKVDPRPRMMLGFVMQVISGIWLTGISLEVGWEVLSANAFLQGLAVGLIWTPIATTTFWTLAPEHRAEAVAVFHLMRNIGSSFFIAWSVAEIIRSTGANYSRMVEFVTRGNELLSMRWVMGEWSLDSVQGLAALSAEITRQATLLGYQNAFVLYTAASLAAVPLVFMVKGPKRIRARHG